jgi:enoyl-CoA hydratase/carnithine racemase
MTCIVFPYRIGNAVKLSQEIAPTYRPYPNDNMLAHDAREGIDAFIEKRAPQWQDH